MGVGKFSHLFLLNLGLKFNKFGLLKIIILSQFFFNIISQISTCIEEYFLN